MLTYVDPPENIGITCQKEPFNIESLRDTLQGKDNTGPMQEERLERIPSVKKLAGPADFMPREEAEYKVCQYCHLWTMYADSSVELKKKSELSQESAVAACKMYVPYICDITPQTEEVVKIFAMEKELRLIKNRGYFPVPQLAPRECKIETTQDKDMLMKEIDEEAVEMLNAIKESEENYRKEQEQARIREEQLRSARQTSRCDINLYPTLANSTPIRNTNTRADQPGVHFNTNPVHHIYATTSDRGEQYEPPENDSILQGATSSPADQLATNATNTAGRNKPWRRNNTANIGSNTFNHRTTNRPTGRNGLQNNNPSNPTDLRNRPTCFRCGEQGHMRGECRKRVFCNHCRSYNHNTKACRKQHDNALSPTHSQIATGYHPTVTPPPLMGMAAATQPAEAHNNPLFNLLDNNQPRTSTLMHTPQNGTSPAAPADLIEGITQIMNRVTNDNKIGLETDPGMDHSTDHQAKIIHSIHLKTLDQITEATITRVTMTVKTGRTTAETTAGTEIISNNQDMNRETKTTQTGMTITKIEIGTKTTKTDTGSTTKGDNKYQHHRNQRKAQVIFEFSDQNVMEMMQTVRGFINLIKANPTTREHYKSNKLATCKYDNEVNELEIQSSSLEQVQQFFNEDSDVIFDALVAADYIDEIEYTDTSFQQRA